ncbi:uncharacterized protein LOC127131613 [Lathyrus oleraceus]|uniref:uncharacterized protein LOC127131613 n=1 Tax=Pisum sativum TaxID=3888 RepID=UPI0021D0A54E|nr:uncharacterized protein LOC127131613 [Pisum sativum]
MAETTERLDQIGGHVTSYMQSEIGESSVGTGPQGTMCAKNNVKKIEMESEKTPAPTNLKGENSVYDENISDGSSCSQLGWMELLRIAYNVTHDIMILYYDNLNIATMSKNHSQHSWTKYSVCCQHSIRKCVKDKFIVLKHEIQSADNKKPASMSPNTAEDSIDLEEESSEEEDDTLVHHVKPSAARKLKTRKGKTVDEMMTARTKKKTAGVGPSKSWIKVEVKKRKEKDGAAKWKFVIQRRVAVERELRKEVVEVKEVMDLIKNVGLMKIVVALP